ncbi:MAG: CBS domain-containing protein [Deltaproteobacteria bacterium]|jgi:CBS domain-containing protein|nr:CBS domain-containing protein [Deltaproteobacteria bacterium]
MEAKDIMTTEVTTVSEKMTVREAADLLFKLKISGLPVINENEELVGMITEKDLIAMALPRYIDKLGSFAYILEAVPFNKKLAEAAQVTVKDIMREKVITVSPETLLPEIARIMLTKRIRRLPVLDNKKIVGIIARSDIVKLIAREAGII